MLGYLVYQNKDYQRNIWFVEHFISEFRKLEIELKLILIDEIRDLNNYVLPDFVVSRVFNSDISLYYENRNIRCFNNHLTSFYGNNKYEAYKLADELNIEHLRVVKGNEKMNYPYILKSLNGHGGKEVYLINKEEDIPLNINLDNYLKQELCSDVGKDMRVYCFDSKIIYSVLRYSNNDFRSNYSLGGDYKEIEVLAYQKEVINKLINYLKPDLVGIDFIYDEGKWKFNELEDVLGTRILYKINNFDIIKMYCEYILNELKGRENG